MKNIASNVLCKGFVLCSGNISPNDEYHYNPADSTVDAKYTQIFYLIEGNGTLFKEDSFVGQFDGSSFTVSNNYQYYKDHNVIEGNKSALVDLRFLKGSSFNFKAGDRGASWICINPIPALKPFDCDLLSNDFIINGDRKERIVVCSKGSITINDKQLKQYNYARIYLP